MAYNPSFNVENHNLMQRMPLHGALTGGVGGAGLGALFAKLAGVNPLLSVGVSSALGGLSGGMTGSYLKNTYNSSMTPEEAAYLRSLGANIQYMR